MITDVYHNRKEDVIPKKNNIFFSYTWKDRAIAMRIYYDLVRSDLLVWRDQVDGLPTHNFKEEIIQEIDNCDYFVFLDSVNYRTSYWCEEEIKYFFQIKKSEASKKIIRCLVQDEKETHAVKELFYEQNYHNYFDFTGFDVYDNDGKYNTAINRLCFSLGSEFIPWANIDSEKDIEDEISAFPISDLDRTTILKAYDVFKTHSMMLFPNAKKHLEILIEDLKYVKIIGNSNQNKKINSFYFNLILIQIEIKDNNLERALQICKEMITNFSSDPRTWNSLAVVYAEMFKTKEALNYIEKALALFDAQTGKFSEKQKIVFLSNKIRFLLKAGKSTDALILQKELFFNKKSHLLLTPEDYLLMVSCYFMCNMYQEALPYLLEGLDKFYGDSPLHSQLGLYYYYVQRDYFKAIEQLEIAHRYEPQVIRYCQELITLYLLSCNRDKLSSILPEISNLSPKTDEDFFCLGKIYEQIGDKSKSKFYYKQCNRNYWEKLIK
ncbi:MAG: TIR domain-containing protein [Bacteroidetes bacterium]|nr:TIR domain-containing protein [Bacteroidota bacterium]